MTQQTDRKRSTADGGSLWEQFDFDASGVASSASYTYPLKIDATRIREGVIVTKNKHATNTMFFKIIGSCAEVMPVDDTDDSWVDIKAEASLAASTGVSVDAYSNKFKWIWVGIKNNSGSGTYKGWHRGTN